MPALLSSVAQHGSIEPLLYEWATTVGKDSNGIVQWLVPGAPAVALVADPDAVKSIFERGRWPKSPLYRDLEPLLGDQSLVLTEGQEWREQRDAYNPAFAGAFLRTAFDGFCEATRELVAVLDEAAQRKEERRVWDLVVLATVEIIFRVGFGEARGLLSRADRNPLGDPLYRAFYDLGTHVSWFLDNVPLNRLKSLPWNVSKTQRLRKELERQLGIVLDGRVEAMRRSGALPAGVRLVDRRDGASGGGCPFAGLASAAAAAAGGDKAAVVPAASDDASSAEGAAAADASTLLEDEQMSLGASAATTPTPLQQQQDNTPTTTTNNDILSMAVSTLVAQGATTIDRGALTSQQATLFAAGHDTTAGAISWAVYFLSRDAKRREKLVAELDAAFEARRRQKRETAEGQQGDGDDVEIPTWEELSSLPYLTAVIKETLRFRPPVGIIARACPVPAPSSSGDADPLAAPRSSDDPARGAVQGVDLRGKIAVVSPYVLHRLERYWGEDASEWVPERWLDNEGEQIAEGAPSRPARALSVPQYAFLPFSRGERDCIGSRFATIEAKVILASLFRRFEFEWAGSEGGEKVRMALTAHPGEGVPMRVARRRRIMRVVAAEEAVVAEEQRVGVAAR
jgi:cytochrome P450